MERVRCPAAAVPGGGAAERLFRTPPAVYCGRSVNRRSGDLAYTSYRPRTVTAGFMDERRWMLVEDETHRRAKMRRGRALPSRHRQLPRARVSRARQEPHRAPLNHPQAFAWLARPTFAMLRMDARPRIATARSDGVANRSSRETGRK